MRYVEIVVCLLVVLLRTEAKVGFMTYDEVKGKPYTVTYNNRSILIDGQPSLFISGSVHPPRATVNTWDTVFQLAKQNGLNMIEIYVFWNYHEPVEGQFNWEGNANLALFVQKCAENNLFVNLRVGPYVCAEWDYGGIPVWLGLKEGIQFRTYNTIWMQYMERWFNQVIKLLLPQFAHNGGPIVLVQVENELNAKGPTAQEYIGWCGKMAAEAITAAPLPILMCNGNSATNTINTCNGNQCTNFITMHGQNGRILIDQPALWTENEGGFQVWGESPSHTTSYFWGRTISDISYDILQWFGRGGSHNNYYMYYGGNNFGRFGGSGVTTMYASDVNICPDTLPHEPKFSHLGLLHATIANYADIIAFDSAQLGKEIYLQYYDNSTGKFVDGKQQIAFVYKYKGRSVAFVENQNSGYVLTKYNGQNYDLPGYSVSIVDGQTGKEVFNSAKISPPSTHRVDTPFPTNAPFEWKIWKEPLLFKDTAQFPSVSSGKPIEQSAAAKGLTDYLWYERNITVSAASDLSITIDSQSANALLVFIDGVFIGTANDHSHAGFAVKQTIKLGSITTGDHWLQILSENLGYDNGMGSGSTGKLKGITGNVMLGTQDITSGNWLNRPSLAGEYLQVYTDKGSQNVPWSSDLSQAGPATWYRAEINLPKVIPSTEAVLLDATGLGRGHVYVNGFDIGRYWTIEMNDGSGNPTQRLYYIPNDILVVGKNVLTLIEVEGASNSSKPRLLLRTIVPTQSSSLTGRFEDTMQTCPF